MEKIFMCLLILGLAVTGCEGKEEREARIAREKEERVARLAKEGAVEPLIELLEDKDVCHSAASALGEIGDKKAIAPLIDIVRNRNSHARREALAALGKIGDKKAIKALADALQDGQLWCDASEVLGNMGNDAVEPLIQALKHKNSETRVGAALALGNIGDKQAVEALLEILKNNDHDVLGPAMDALQKIGKPAIDPLLRGLRSKDNSLRFYSARVLKEMADESTVGPLIAALETKNEMTRQIVASALMKITKQNFGTSYERWKKWYDKQEGSTPLRQPEESPEPVK